MNFHEKPIYRLSIENVEERILTASHVLSGAAVSHPPAAVGSVANRPPSAANPYAVATIKTVIQGDQGAAHSLSAGGHKETWVSTVTNVLGWELCSYHLELDWTSDGRNITSRSYHAWGTANVPGVTYVGSNSLTYGHTYFRVWSQGHFQFQLPYGGGSIDYADPVIDETVHA